jgi:hypothetical protein
MPGFMPFPFMSTTSLFHVAFMPAFVFPRRFHADFALLLLPRVMSLVNNVTASRRRLTLLTPFQERL